MKNEGEKGFLKRTAQGAVFVTATLSTSIEANAESIENINQGSEEFAVDVSAEKAFIEMPNGVLYLDSSGKPVAIVPATIIDGVNPGKGFLETGRVTEGYASAWKREARELAEQSSENIISTKYNWRDIQSALNNKNESMDSNEIHSIMDIVYYFGDKDVRDGDGLSRIEYLKEHLVFDASLPEEIQTELRFLAAGIAGEESRFRDGIKSSANAGGIFQFMPETVDGLGYGHFVRYEGGKAVALKSIPYTVQVEMLGKHLSNIYKELYGHLDTSEIDQIQQLFASEKDFNTFFLTPVMINAYNTGAGRMSKAIKEFATPDRVFEMHEKYNETVGYDLFHDLTEFAEISNKGSLSGYKIASASYTVKVFGYAKSIAEGYDAYKQNAVTYEVASN
jgi:hypothetical protein